MSSEVHQQPMPQIIADMVLRFSKLRQNKMLLITFLLKNSVVCFIVEYICVLCTKTSHVQALKFNNQFFNAEYIYDVKFIVK